MIEYFQNSKMLNWLLIIAITGDFAVPYLLATFYKGYSHNLMVMSSLGNPNSPVRFFYNTWLIILGILLIFSSAIIFSKYWLISKPLTIATVVLILIFAIGAGILSGIFSVNQSKEIITVSSQIHGVGAVLGFIAMLFVPLFLAILSYKNNNNLEGMIFSISFIFAFVFFTFFIMADKPQFQSTFIKNEGLWQRLSLLLMYFPLGYIAVENLIYLMHIK
ncbi:DUF998 domain-containing protein [Clostridium intestinale]|uniref:DUF998 domain-containing protein n=1 Tax=Clostridium intestinale URNW TaxID=1294142 RepID=U2Q278_9CLOT|nr:DUF998 domain-containing protein [Clostridium intestinale]ERK30159.1 hypothetical protein CINTURNW_2256 [Clostridium intestinale URNW]